MIKYINKKYAAISIALSLLPSVLTGCTPYGFKYKENSNNEIVVEGTVSYEYLKNCYYVEIENPDYDKIEYYISEKNGIYKSEYYTSKLFGYTYKDLLTNKEVYRRNLNDFEYYSQTSNETNRNFVNEIKLEDYLYSSNFIKSNYTVEDVEKILDDMKKIEENKKLVKE